MPAQGEVGDVRRHLELQAEGLQQLRQLPGELEGAWVVRTRVDVEALLQENLMPPSVYILVSEAEGSSLAF